MRHHSQIMRSGFVKLYVLKFHILNEISQSEGHLCISPDLKDKIFTKHSLHQKKNKIIVKEAL